MIQAKAMLVDLTISQWTGTKFDKKVSAEVEKAHGATDAGNFNKRLIDKTYLEPISKLAGAVRAYHYSRTLPWTDKGQRLLPAKLFMEYSAEIRKFKAEFAKLVGDFLVEYPNLVQKARVRLNTMFQPEDYPEVHRLRQAFGIELEITQVPDAADFRVDVGIEARKEIQEEISASVNARQAKAIKDCYARVFTVVDRISKQCSNEKARIYDSLIDNASDLVEVLDGLNITNDPDITSLQTEVKALLVKPDTLRTSPTARKRTADAADAILAKLNAI